MRPLRVFIVDDDQDFADSLAMIIEMRGHEVEVAFSGEEAIARFQEHGFDITFMDVRLPGKNGVETVQEIQARLIQAGKKDLPIIFITGYADYGDELNAIFVGEVLTKPIEREKLLMTIREYL